MTKKPPAFFSPDKEWAAEGGWVSWGGGKSKCDCALRRDRKRASTTGSSIPGLGEMRKGADGRAGRENVPAGPPPTSGLH